MAMTRCSWMVALAACGMLAWACGSDVQSGGGDGQGGTTSSGGGSGGATTSSSGGGSPGGGGQGGEAQGGAAQGGGSASGGAGPCLAATNDYGDCDMALGWAFDGNDCVPMSGCGCEPDCAAFSDDFTACVAGCTGFCDEAAFLGAGIAADGWGEGDYCDGIYTCVKADVEPLLAEVMTAVDCSAGQAGCPDGTVRCTLGFAGTVGADLAAELCAATLIEDLDALTCEVFGG